MCVPRVPGDARYVRTGMWACATAQCADETAVPVALTGPRSSRGVRAVSRRLLFSLAHIHFVERSTNPRARAPRGSKLIARQLRSETHPNENSTTHRAERRHRDR